MTFQDDRLRDLFESDPGDGFEYHQDYREAPAAIWDTTHPAFLPILALTIVTILYHFIVATEYRFSTILELLWNWLVYLTPSQLVDLAQNYTNPLRISDPNRSVPRTHAEKSQAMRQILGLDASRGIIQTVTQAGKRRLSILPGRKMNLPAKDDRPAGLGNWDNSCYQNSVLQGLASLDSLSGYLTSPIKSREIEGLPEPDMKMSDSLRGLINTLNDPANNGKRIWTPPTLKNMSSWQQQDAQEYYSKVLDEIDNEVGKAAQWNETMEDFRPLNSETLPLSTYRNPLEGLMAQRVGCTKCGYSEGLSMIPFNCLTVPLGRAAAYNISQCLDEYTKLEQIEGVECGKCTLLKAQRQLSIILERVRDVPEQTNVQQTTAERLKAVNVALEDDDFDDKTLLSKCQIPARSQIRVSTIKTRQAAIARPPRSLALHVNRSLFDEYSGELRKNYSEVRFPRVLDLGPWCLGSSGTTNNHKSEEWSLNPEEPMIASIRKPSRLRGPLYELRAVVTHYGRHENGHYICYKKYPVHTSLVDKSGEAERWWCLSDDEVTMVNEENVLHQGGVFMLFYDCIEPVAVQTSTIASMDPLPTSSPAKLSTQQESESEVLAAMNVPLPERSDLDLLDADNNDQEALNRPEIKTSKGSRTALSTSTSEYDEGGSEENQREPYEPTKPIVTKPYLKPSDAHKEGEAVTSQQGMPSGNNLVMV